MEQVTRGQELLQMLREPSASCDSVSVDHDDAKPVDTEVRVIVKHTFIEIVDPHSSRRMNRSMSDSVLPSPSFSSNSDDATFWRGEKLWQKIASDVVDSDASTTISNENEDLHTSWGGVNSNRKDTCWSDDEGAAEGIAPMQQWMASQYSECCWWMPMNYDPSSSVLCGAMADGSMSAASYMSPQWAEQTDMECAEHVEGQEWRTTVMLRNMPNNYSRDMLLELVESMGFAGCYDFAYLPVDFKSQAGLGYAFINFVSTAEAQRCFECFEGFSDWKVPSEKVCTVTWGSPYQGLEAHIERYQNSPVMHHSIPDEWKPVLLDQCGVRIAFPVPTKPIKMPKIRTPPAGN
jgi:hypothetical protein